MHLTAEQNAKRFFETYVSQNKNDVSFLEIGSYLSTFNIRSLSPTNSKYVGVDLGEGPGVDIVLDDPYKLPFEDNFFDFCFCCLWLGRQRHISGSVIRD